MAGSGPFAKCLWVDSPESSKSDHDDDTPLEQAAIQLVMLKITMAWYPTELITHLEPAEIGDAEEEIPLPHATGNVMEETEAISTQ